MNQPEFTVRWLDPEGHWYTEQTLIMAEEAVQLAWSLANRPAGELGIIREIRIIDGLDFTVFQWIFGKGVVFPEQLELA